MAKRKANNTLSKKYQEMSKDRQPYLDRAREFSKLTIPYIMPEDTDNTGNSIKHKWQNLGSEAVNTFSNKFINTLFPIGSPFFSLDIDEFELSEAEAKAYADSKVIVDSMYLKIVLGSMRRFSKLNFRSKLTLYAKHLLICGNCCLQMFTDSVKVVGLDKYVTKRSQSGILIHGIIKEKHEVVTLPDEVLEKLSDKEGKEDCVTIYTSYKRISRDTLKVTQETEEGTLIHEEELKDKDSGVIFGRMIDVDGEDYGRGYVEDYSNDIFAFDFLSEYKARGAATMLDVKYLVRPGATTDLKTLNSAPPGTYVRGMKDDIIPLELAKYGDTALIQSIMDEYKQRISRAFLIVAGTVRDSERTTKYEIEQNVLDLENARAGIYSSQATELQLPIATNLINDYNDKIMEEGVVEPTISTGLAAIGKQNDLNRLRAYTELMGLPATWPELMQSRLDLTKYDSFIASMVYLDTSLFFKSDEQMKKAEEADSSIVASDTLTDNISAGLGKAIGENIVEG